MFRIMLMIAAAVLWGLSASVVSAAPGTAANPTLRDPVNMETEAFLRAAEALYNAALSGNIFETRLSLRQTETRLRSLPMRKIATAEGIEALADSVVRMKRTVAAAKVEPQKWVDGAAEIRLAADALAHRDKPLWHQYRKVLREDAALLAAAIEKTGASAPSRARYAELKRHYQLIRTSVLLHSEPSRIESADSIIRYADRLLGSAQPDPALLAELSLPLKQTMDSLFPGEGQDRPAVVAPVAPPPWGWSAFMGTFIVSVLTWVGWRRYNGIDRITPRENPPPEHHEHR